MFANTRAFSSFAVDDIAKARSFYGETLGVGITELDQASGVMSLNLAGGQDVLIYHKPDFVPATYTVLNFAVDDIDQAVDELVERGITMERYEGFAPDAKGIVRGPAGPPIAWFKDPAGNIIAVLEEPPAAVG